LSSVPFRPMNDLDPEIMSMSLDEIRQRVRLVESDVCYIN